MNSLPLSEKKEKRGHKRNIKKAATHNLIIPRFSKFTQIISEIYNKTSSFNQGTVASYIPQLARVDPNLYGVSLCTIDAQRFNIGDTKVPFTVQSMCKAINYCIVLEEYKEEYVHKFMGREPSGKGFNELLLNSEGLPHNPMTNAGGIMCCSLIKQKEEMAARFEYVANMWYRLSGNQRPGFDAAVFLSEKETGDRNYALGYYMRESKIYPPETNLINTLLLYFECCSIEINAESLAIVAATLANSGICPTTNKQVLSSHTVVSCLSLMYSCGMYDFSGEFAFVVGLPAKSGVSGGLLVVVPGVLGIGIYSPRIDRIGNSVRGINFCKELVKIFSFHNYDNLLKNPDKIDPRVM